MDLLDTTLGFTTDASPARIKRLAIKAANVEGALLRLSGYEPQISIILDELEAELGYYEKRLQHIATIAGDDAVNNIRIAI